MSVSLPGRSLVLRPTLSGLLRRDFGSLGLAVLIPVAFVLAFVTNGKRPLWAMIVGTAIALACAVVFVRSARSYIATDGKELHARGWLFSAVDCQVADIKRLWLSNEGAIFGMTRPWSLSVDLPFGQRKSITDDVKRFAWLDVFRLADALNRKVEGPAMPYLAFVACGSRHLPSERGTVAPGGAWALVQKLRGEAATGKLLLNGSAGESWIYLIKGRNLRLEEDWPQDVTADVLSPSTQVYEFERSALSEEEIAMVLRVLEDKWLGASPTQGITPASASG